MLKGMGKYLLVGLVLHTGAAMAETIYVHDYLRLGIRANPNSSESPITVVTTGDSLEVLERQGGYIKVRSEDGVVGWVSKAYVSSEKPARLRLEQLQEEYKRQKAELKDLRQELTAAMERNELVDSQISELMNENASLHQQVSRFYSENAKNKRQFTWLYQSLAIIALFLFGIFLGVRWQRKRIAERLGGLEI